MSTQTDNLQRIADAIRASSGSSDQIQASLFYQKINQLKRYRWADSALTYCEPRALEAVDVAKSYWIARASGRKFVYSGGATFLDGSPLNNASGQGLIDCSTYIHLVMRGIPYHKSPYVNTAANATYNASALATNTAYAWADDHIRSSNTLGGMVRYAADLVERGLVDGVSMGRPLLADPDLPKKAYENRFDDITPCGSCGGRCITPEDPHHPVCKCHINPLVGHEYDYPFNPTDKPKKVLVIGAGPGGMYTAVTAAERGHDVTVWEKSKQIGGQLNLAVVSPGKQEMCKWLTHLNYRAKKAGVKFEFKKEATVENVKEFAPDAVVVATGATPLIPTFIKGVGDYPIITTHDILSRKVTIPKGTVCILGGGEVACETAEMLMADARPNSFATTGSIGDVEVTLVEMQPQLMTGVCLPNRNIALASLRREGVKSYINSKVLEVTEHEVKIQHKDGTEEWLKGFDYIVLGLGSRKYDPLSEELKAFVPEVHVIGDAIKPGQSSDAMHQGFHVGYEL